SQQGTVNVLPTYQSWQIEGPFQINEFSVPIAVYYPVNRNLSFYLKGNQANISGDVEQLSGITDTQLACNYHHEASNLVFSLGMNLPSGMVELSSGQFMTSAYLSYNYFNFQVPSFGQGFNVCPGITWAKPLSDNFVLGLGASYQFKGKFRPIKGMLNDYDPGEELLITAGLDARLSEATTVAADIIFTKFGTDKVGPQKVFVSGNSIVVTGQFRSFFGYNELRLLGRFRGKGKNSLVIGGILQQEVEQSTPVQLEGEGLFRWRYRQTLYLTFLGEAKSYLPTGNFPGVDIFGFGVQPEIEVSESMKILPRVKFLFGDFPGGTTIAGWELGLGINYRF
ncbi:MAG: hypothetical protein ONB11_11525, partial [candidate division KSB1 bacterium]|nr:hypothetical protein [candidate division KSB1 bacterium]